MLHLSPCNAETTAMFYTSQLNREQRTITAPHHRQSVARLGWCKISYISRTGLPLGGVKYFISTELVYR